MSYIPAVTGIRDTNNSSTVALTANSVFTGTTSEVLLYSEIVVNVSANVNSASAGLSLQFSTDGTNWDTKINETFIAPNLVKTTPVLARYFRIVFTNGTTNQTSFRLQTILHPSKNITTDITTTFDPIYIDPFQKILTSQSTALGSFDFRIGKNSDYWDETLAGSATSTHNANQVCIDMTCTTGSTDSVIRQTYRQFEYIRGNSQTILISSNFNGNPVTGNTRRLGYFDSNNGAFFEIDATTFKVVRRTSTSGSVVNDSVNQANFNIDPLNGSGPSGLTIDLTKQQLFYIQFSWLGTNILEFGVYINNTKIRAHIFYNSNNLATAWCQSGQLPLRFENFNTTTAGSSTTLKQGCCAVFTNGSPGQYSIIRSVSSTIAAPITVTTTESVWAGIRLKTTTRNVGVKAKYYTIMPFAVSNSNTVLYLRYRVLLRPTLTGANWATFTDITDVLTTPLPTAFSGGIVIDQGFVSTIAAARISVDIPSTTDGILGYSINNTPDSLVIVMATVAGTADIQFVGYFEELK